MFAIYLLFSKIDGTDYPCNMNLDSLDGDVYYDLLMISLDPLNILNSVEDWFLKQPKNSDLQKYLQYINNPISKCFSKQPDNRNFQQYIQYTDKLNYKSINESITNILKKHSEYIKVTDDGSGDKYFLKNDSICNTLGDKILT